MRDNIRICQNCNEELSEDAVEFVEEGGCEFCMSSCDFCSSRELDEEIVSFPYGDYCESCVNRLDLTD